MNPEIKLPMELSLIPYPPNVKVADDAPIIYISNFHTAECILYFNDLVPIDVVINLCNSDHKECIKEAWNDEYIRYEYTPIMDHEDQDIIPTATKNIEIINSCRNQNVLVHCHAGWSRSVSIVIAYFMDEYGLDFDMSFKHVKTYRSVANPNRGFIEQLKEWYE
jgi:protein-tyrosine phosphatase